jgi:uncharacterized cupin superfamily protein
MSQTFINRTSVAISRRSPISGRWCIPAHWHTQADEAVYVLEGDFVQDGESYGPGSYFRGKAGTMHGPHSTVEGCTVVTHFSAELDVQTGPVPQEV